MPTLFKELRAAALSRTSPLSSVTASTGRNLSRADGSEEAGVHVPVVSVVGGDAGGLLVEANDDAGLPHVRSRPARIGARTPSPSLLAATRPGQALPPGIRTVFRRFAWRLAILSGFHPWLQENC